MRSRYLVLALLLVLTTTVPSSASPVPQPPELWTVTADGATESAIATGPEGQYLTRSFEWSPDGTKLVFTKAGDIWISNPDGTGQVNLTSTDGTEDFDPHWSPDGTEIVFVRTTGNGSDLLIAEADGTGIRPLTTDEGYERSPRWSPTGEWILFQTICVDCDEDLELIRPDGSERLVMTDDDVRDLIAVWSPDGTQVAIVRGPGTTNGNELWVIDADATDLVNLATNVMLEAPEWSFEGSWLAYRSGALVRLVEIATGSIRTLDPGGQGGTADPDWSPVALELAFTQVGALFVYDVDADSSVQIADVPLLPPDTGVSLGAQDPDWSPDGSEIAYGDNHDIAVVASDGSVSRQVVTSQDHIESEPRWSPSGARIAFLREAIALGGGGRSVTLVASRDRVTYDGTFRLGGSLERTSAEIPTECIAGVDVILERMVLGSADVQTVGTTITEESGSFRFTDLEADKSANYVARVEQVAGCSESFSNPEPVKVRKKVTLSGPPIAGGRVRLKADVEPCKGHRGDRVLLQKRKGGRWVTVDRDRSDDRCRAVFVQAIGSRSVFRAKAPKTDEDHLAGTSATLVIHVD